MRSNTPTNIHIVRHSAVLSMAGTGIICVNFNKLTEAFLKEINFPHTCRSLPGGHNWEYWTAAYQRMLPELAEHFNR